MKNIIRCLISKVIVIILILSFVMAGISGCMYTKDTFFSSSEEPIKKAPEEKSDEEIAEEVRLEQEKDEKAIRLSEKKEVIVNEENNPYEEPVLDKYDAMEALVSMQYTLGIKDARQEYEVESVKQINETTSLYVFRQYYERIPIINGKISMQVNESGEISMVRGEYRDISNIDTDVKLSKDDAQKLAEGYLRKEGKYNDDFKVACKGPSIYAKDDQDLIWYEVQFSNVFNNTTIPYITIVVDANTGEIISSRSNRVYETVSGTAPGQFGNQDYYNYELNCIKNGTVGIDKQELDSLKTRQLKSIYATSDDKYVLEDRDRNIKMYDDLDNGYGEEIICDSPENTDGVLPNESAVDAFSNLEFSYDYFSEKFQTIVTEDMLPTFVGSEAANDNAYLSYDPFTGDASITVGTRTADNAPEFSAYIDIMAHEYTHGITHVVSDIYEMVGDVSDEQNSISYALGEGFADIFGIIIKAEYFNQSIADPDTWFMGEDIRDIPNARDNAGLTTDLSQYVEGVTDCHSGSTLISYPAFLMATGGLNYDPEKAFTADELASAWDFAQRCVGDPDFRVIRSCLEQYAYNNKLSSKKIESIFDAFDMVGIVSEPGYRKQLDTSAILHVYDQDNQLIKDYHLTVTYAYDESAVLWDDDINDADFCISGIEPGFYKFRFSDINDHTIGRDFFILVNDEVPDDLTTYESECGFPTPIHCESDEVCLVLDVSGSMQGQPLEQTKAAAIQFVQTIMNNNPNIFVDIVAFSGEASVVCQKTRSKKEAMNAISGLSSMGSTNIHDALNRSYDLLKLSESINNPKLIVMSDGVPESGPSDDGGYDGPIVKLADEIKSSGIIIYSLGFFHNLNSEELASATSLMDQIASEGYHYNITEVNDLQMVFDNMASESIGRNSMVIKMQCPIDVIVKHNGEVLSSEKDSYNTSASFGIMTFEGEDNETKILRLDKSNQYEIIIKGNGNGKMNYSISYPNEDGEYKDVRKVKNIPIKSSTYISTNASMEDVDAKGLVSVPKLNVDEDGDGKYDSEYLLGKDEHYNTFDEKMKAYLGYSFIITCALLALIYVFKVIYRIRRRNTCVCGHEYDKEYDFCGYCGHKKKGLLFFALGDIESSNASIAKDIVKIVISIAMVSVAVLCWRLYKSTPNTVLREYNKGHYETASRLYDEGIVTNLDEKYLLFIFEKNFMLHGIGDNLTDEQKNCLSKMNLSFTNVNSNQ